jgi:hypothetical protein
MTTNRPKRESDRGTPAGFDPKSGEVFGSGAGAGGNEDSDEDYDGDLHGQDTPPAGSGTRRS